MQNMEKISIIVPIYKVEEYLPECLDSLLAQTYPNIEVVCVNDGSPDHCDAILAEYSKRDERIIVINQQNTGLSGARNTGLKNASGEYIMFVDGDDWVDPRICAELYAQIKEHDAQVAMCGYMKEFANTADACYVFAEEKKFFSGNTFQEQIYRRLFGQCGAELAEPQKCDALTPACMKLFSRKVIEDILFVDTKQIGTEDLLYLVYVFARVEKLVYIKKPYYHYRRTNEASLTMSHKADLFEKWQNLYNMITEFMEQNCLGAEFERAFQNRIVLSMIGLGLNEIYAGKTKSRKQKAGRLKKILKTDRYEKAFCGFDMTYLPVHWKVFFVLCKYKRTYLLTYLLEIMEYLRKRQGV